MELLTNVEQQEENVNTLPVIYTAYGWIAGVFQPEKKKKKKMWGVLITEDGQEFAATMDWCVLLQIKKQMQDRSLVTEFLQSVHYWKVYPRTQPLRFDLVKVRAQPWSGQKQAKKIQPVELDKFRVVGEIRYINQTNVVMRIERNELVPNRGYIGHPIHLKILGSIPTSEVGQIWELEVQRQETKLKIVKAEVYQPSVDDIRLYKLLFEQKNARQITQLGDAPATEPLPRYGKASIMEAPESFRVGHQDLQQSETKPKECKAAALINTPKAPPQSDSTITKGDGNGRSKNKSAPPIAGNGEVTPQQQSSRFTVQVNGQVFIGQSSVTLNRRLLCIDSKPVAQSKLVVVIGQPKTMQADGSVTKGNDRSVLMSK